MKRIRNLKWPLFVILLAIIGCAWYWAADHVRSMWDRSEVAKMTENMKTVCVGRYLVDVPANAEVSLSHERVAGFEIETVEESEAAFQGRVAAREASIAAGGQAIDGTGGLVEARDLKIPGMVGRTLVYGLNRGHLMKADKRVDSEFVSVEAHAHTGDLSFSLSTKYADEARARLAEAMLARLRLRQGDEIPSSPGFCIGRAVFVEPLPARKAEHIVLHLGLPDLPDLGMVFASLAGGTSSRTLLTRIADMDAESSLVEMLRVTKLRMGQRTINDVGGEEVLERARELNFATTVGFVWEAQGVKNDPLRPFLSLELHAGISREPGGKPADSSLHEDALLALWDVVSSSIRLRPNAHLRPADLSATERMPDAASRHN